MSLFYPKNKQKQNESHFYRETLGRLRIGIGSSSQRNNFNSVGTEALLEDSLKNNETEPKKQIQTDC